MGFNDKNIDTSINDRVKHIRKQNSLTQSAFAQSIGIKQATLSDIERHKIGLSNKLLSRIVEIYKVNAEWLLTGENGIKEDHDTLNIVIPYKGVDIWPHFKGGENYVPQEIGIELNGIIRRNLNFFEMYMTHMVFSLGYMFDPDGIIDSEIIKNANAFVKQFKDLSREREKFESFSIAQKFKLIKEIEDAIVNMGETATKFINVIEQIGLKDIDEEQ